MSAKMAAQWPLRDSWPMNSPRCPPEVVARVTSAAGVEAKWARAKTCGGGVM
jgi:hypothetical protein